MPEHGEARPDGSIVTRWIARHALPGTMLDVGSDADIVAVLGAREDLTVVGLCRTPGALEEARADAARLGVQGRARFEHTRALVLPFDAGSFDTICMRGSVEETVSYGRLASEARRVLREDGTLIVAGRYGRRDTPGSTDALLARPLVEALAGGFDVFTVEIVERALLLACTAAPGAEPAYERALRAVETGADDLIRTVDALEEDLAERDRQIARLERSVVSERARSERFRLELERLRGTWIVRAGVRAKRVLRRGR